MEDILTKIGLGIKTLCLYMKYKIRYGKQIAMSKFNPIRGKLLIDLEGNSTLSVGDFMMTQGPLYLKVLNGGA